MRFYNAKITLGTIPESALKKAGYESSIKGAREYFLSSWKAICNMHDVKGFVPSVSFEDIEPIDVKLTSGDVIPTYPLGQEKDNYPMPTCLGRCQECGNACEYYD